MPARQAILERHVRPLYSYYQTELLNSGPDKLGADMRTYLLAHIRAWAAEGRVENVGAGLWFELLTMCYQLLVRSGTTSALEVANRFADQVPDLLASDLALGDRMSVYDILRHLFFMAGTTFADYRPFDERVVRPYSAWMRAQGGAGGERRRLEPGRRLRIGYMCNYPAMMGVGRVLAPLFISMILDHREGLDHDCIAYSVGEPDASWRRFLADAGIPVVPLPFTGYAARGDCGFPQVLAQLQAERLDILLTDENLALPGYVFEHRVAPVQVYVAMAMPFWGLQNLDYIMLGSNSLDVSPDLPPERKIARRYGYNARFLDTRDQTAIAAVREGIPPHHRVAGTFSRFVRIGEEFLAVLARILDQNPDVTVILGGNGDPSTIRAFMAQSPHRDRIRFFPHDVDMLVYGRAIDFMLDTLPLRSGNVCREVQYFGKPVVALRHEGFTKYQSELRDPELVCADVDAYVQAAGRLIRDPAFLAARSTKAREIGLAEASTGNHLANLRELIARASA